MKRIMKKRKITKMIVLLLAMVMMFSIPIEASAAKVTAAKNWHKAKTVKKGKTSVTVPKMDISSSGYVKFKAPATKTYKFTINNVRKYGKKSSQGIEHNWISFGTKGRYDYLNSVAIKQNGKKTYTLWVCSQMSWSIGRTSKITSSTSLPSRSVSIRMKKGQTIYIQSGIDMDGKTCYDLTIK